MTESYRRIGELISVIDNRNFNGDISKLIGISIDKCYIPSVANVIGTDLRNYKVIRKGQFACSLMQVSRDQRIPLAMYPYDDPAIMSPAYMMFEVNDPNTILSEYMELWFMRAEFDREASFYAVGGVRGSLDWEDFCNMKLPVPPISEQRKIVHDYQVIKDRIELLRKMNEKLENIGTSTYQYYFLDYIPYQETLHETKDGYVPENWNMISLGDLCEKITDGSHYSPKESENSKYPMLSVKDMGHYGFDYSSCKYMDLEDYKKMLAGDCVPKVDDILIAKDGSYLKEVFIINSFVEQGILSSIAIFRANQAIIYPELLLYLLKSPRVLQEVRDNYVTGSAITRIVLKNFKKLKLLVPPLEEQKRILPLLRTIRFQVDANNREIGNLNDLLKHQLSILSKGA